MKALFTAAGSIGSRHIINLSKICLDRGITIEIDVLRKTNRTLPDNVKQCVRKEIWEDGNLDESYDLLFITDETGSHYDTINKYGSLAKSVFVEKPVFDSAMYDLKDLLNRGDDRVIYVAAPIRFTKYYKNIKQIVNDNRILAARIIFSDYMPGWQKGRDYRQSFRCFKERGGGVDLDSIHELDYVIDLFGIPDESKHFSGKYSSLEMNACDMASYIFSYADKLVEIHLDYFGRKRTRNIELYTENDVIVVDFDKACCSWKASGKVLNYGPDSHFYEDEMEYFMDLSSNSTKIRNINSIEHAVEVLKIAKGVF